jgi:glycosyltransferase involved in cell wall biosynthesis
MNKDNFCIVTPNLNMGRYLAETIESVLSNLRKNDLYYIIDGGSTDESLTIIKKYSKWLSGWRYEPDRGYADAINKGFLLSATSRFQAWLNSGDLLLPNSLDVARNALIESNCDMIYGNDLLINDEKIIIQVTNGQVLDLKNLMLFAGWTPPQDACFWRSEIYNRIGGLNINLRYAADFDLFLRMAIHGRYQPIDHIFSVFRAHSGQKSVQFNEGYESERRDSMKVLQAVNVCTHQLSYKFFYWIKIRLHNYMFRKHRLTEQVAGKTLSEFIACHSN